jgi:capsular exopolysaccharide synthesis family protein
VKAIIKEINTAEVLLEGELASAMDRLKIESDHLIDLQKTLNAKMPEYHKSMAAYMEVTNAEQIINGSMVQWKVHLENLTKEQERIEYAIEREHVVFNYSGITEINDVPVSPNRFTLLLLTTVVGIGLGLGIPFLIEYLDHTLSNLEEVETTFQLRGLGIVPKLESADTTVAMMDVEQSKKTHLLENFRVIRTNLLSMGSVTKPPHVMMVTSAMPKEGKTVVSSNLALSFAQTGAKTLLMDTDLRRGRLHRLFGYRKQPGLSGVLLGQHSLEDAIRPTAHENLFILSAGQHLETGTELLGSQQFKDVMITLRQRFERIVVDTPPVLGLSETSVIQGLIDGVLFVIWSGHTPVKAVKSAIEMLQSNGANFYGFILNRLDLSASANYYQYYYYSHDYYYHYTPRPLENIT